MYQRKNHLDYRATALMVFLCFLWGYSQITIKLAGVGVSPIMQAGIRSLIAVVLLTVWMSAKKIPVFQKDGTLLWGIAAGLLFSIEFVLIYWGLSYTSASRAVIFIYLAPFVVALGTHWFIPNESLNKKQITGLLLAFCGILVAFGEGLTVLNDEQWKGDLACVIAAIFWGATTLLIRASKLTDIAPSRTLYYQLFISALLLPLFSVLMKESGVTLLSPVIIACLLFQGVIVAFISYLTWFWLIGHYPAARLSAYTFFTPLFGVLCGVIFLSEVFTTGILVALVVVTVGIYLVNSQSDKKTV